MAALQAAGLTVEPAGEVDEPIFNTTARAIQVNDAQIQVFEFPSEEARQQASDTIGCLGLANADEACTQAIVPGWQIIVRVGDQQYEVRTDMEGRVVRWRQEAKP